MARLQGQFHMTAVVDGRLFSRAVGTGVVTEATSLPSKLWETGPEGVVENMFRDSWGHLFHVKITPNTAAAPEQGVTYYDLLIWSDGPNGLNELGKGDDMSSSITRLKCTIQPEADGGHLANP